MKRILSLILSLTIILALVITVHAITASNPEITISDAEVTLYDADKTVTIVLDTPECYGIEGVWSVSAAGSANSIELTDIDTAFTVVTGEDKLNISTGQVLWNDLTFENPQSGDDLLIATYSIPAGTPNGSYTVTFTCDVFTGADWEPFDTDIVYTATIVVTNHVCSDSATDRDHLCDDSLCGKQVGDHNFVGGDCNCGEGLRGDLNLDGIVDLDDLTLLARHVAGIEEATDAATIRNADVNKDGVIDAEDLTLHARYITKVISDWE